MDPQDMLMVLSLTQVLLGYEILLDDWVGVHEP
jgi:hypothetical protein